MSTLIILLITLPFGIWGLYLFSRLPEKDSFFYFLYPLITLILAGVLFAGGSTPYWQIEKGPLSYYALVEAIESGDTSLASHDFSAASIFLGSVYLPTSVQSATSSKRQVSSSKMSKARASPATRKPSVPSRRKNCTLLSARGDVYCATRRTSRPGLTLCARPAKRSALRATSRRRLAGTVIPVLTVLTASCVTRDTPPGAGTS